MIRLALISVVTLGLLQWAAGGGALAQYDTEYDESGLDKQFDEGDIDRQFGKSGLDHDDLDPSGLDHQDLDPSGLDPQFDATGIDNPTDAPPITPTPGGEDLGTSSFRAN